MSELTDQVYELIAGLDPASAQVVAGMIAAEAPLPSAVIAKAYTEFKRGEQEQLRRSILRQYVAKRAAGADVDSLVELAATIGKAANIPMGFHFDPNEHGRDERGRFRAMHKTIRHDNREPMDEFEEGDAGIPHPDLMVGWTPRKLSPQERAKYQQAYQQISEAVAPYSNMPPGMAHMVVQYHDGTRQLRPLHPGSRVNVIPDQTARKVEVHVQAPIRDTPSRQAMTFDAVRAVTGNPGLAAHLVTTDTSGQTKQLLDGWSQRPGEEYTSAAAFRRMRAGADLLTQAAGPFLPAPAYLATRTASYVGQFGPQAQQVFGPAVDRAKYRYRGTERKLDPKVREALQQIRRENKDDPNAAREKMVYGDTDTIERPARRPGGDALEPVVVWKPSPLVSYLKDQLPKQHLSALNRMSGHIPPSQGVIIDRQGRASAQMVGHGDDWYLPFNLKNLGALNGGEYLRTRTNGGLTTEDLYTGLMTGARSMSVVSHNGVYTMEFDDTLRGSRRYGDVARQMTERYGQLLDAVEAEKVPANDLDPTVYEEIHEKAAQRANPGTEEYQQLVQDAIDQHRNNPVPSQAMREQWFGEFLAEAAARQQTRNGRTMTVNELVREKVIKPTAQQIADDANVGLEPGGVLVNHASDPDIEAAAVARYEANPEAAVGMLNLAPQYRRYVGEKARQYRDSVKPMQLNGPGYEYAMHALQEQFPYFVARVKYTPWDATKADAGRDYGYVKPRFNRPAAALSGYYDASILGHGKVGADTTRYQNFGVMRRLGRSHEATGRGAVEQERKQTDRTPPPVAPTAPTAPTPPTSPAVARRQADLGYVRHFLAQEKFSPDTTLGDNGDTFGGERVEQHRNKWMGDPDILDGEFLPMTVPMADVENMDDEQLHRHAAQLAALQAGHNLFDLDPLVEQRYRRGGVRPQQEQLNGAALAVAGNRANHDREFDLGFEFEPGRARAHYLGTFNQHPQIEQAKAATGIDSLDDPDFDRKLTAHQLELQDHMDAWREFAAGNGPEPDYPAGDLADEARNAVMLRQLHRRYHEAAPRTGGSTGSGAVAPGGGVIGGPSIPLSSFTRPMRSGVSRLGTTYSYSAN